MTEVGKVLKKIRLNADETLTQMAQKLDMSKAYLSAIENGKRNVPQDLEIKINSIYNLDINLKLELNKAIAHQVSSINFEINNISDKKRELILKIANSHLEENTIEKLNQLIEKGSKAK